MARSSAPRILLKSVRYPTYQLWATAGNTKEPAEHQLVIGALTVLEWLRTKFREFEIPEAFQAPSPAGCGGVSISDLKSAHIDCGYTVETVCIPEEKLWAFRLIEPDLTTKWENGEEVSAALPGRLFETNIAFRVADNRMQMGVCIIVSEPEDTGEDRQATVLRPAVVSRLAEDPRLGLTAGYPIQPGLVQLNGRDRLKQLKDYLRKGALPAVVFCGQAQAPNLPFPAAVQFPAAPSLGTDKLSQLLRQAAVPVQAPPLPETSKEPPYDTDLFARSRFAYVHSFLLPPEQFDAFGQVFQTTVRGGDVLLLETAGMGGGVTRWTYSGGKKEDNFHGLMTASRDYPRKKPVDFGSVVFLSTAKVMLLERYQQANMTAEDTVRLYEDRIQAIQEAHRDQLMAQEDRVRQQAEKIARLKAQLDETEAAVSAARSQAAGEVAKIQAKMDAMAGRLEYFQSLPQRPKTPQEIPAWVASRFAGRLELHPRAVRLIEGVSASEVDMRLLCDAIEYLATEYRDLKRGAIQWEDATHRCSEKYGRPFEVTGCGEVSVEMYASQYKIKYRMGAKGKPVESVLDEHLKVGNTAGNLIRIYFLYDSQRDVIVVGSLPYHLKVAQIKA